MPSTVQDRRLQESSYEDSGQLGSVVRMLVSYSARGGIRWLPSYCWSPGRPASLISRHLVQTFLALDFFKYFVYLAAVVPIVSKLSFLLNYRGFELE